MNSKNERKNLTEYDVSSLYIVKEVYHLNACYFSIVQKSPFN